MKTVNIILRGLYVTAYSSMHLACNRNANFPVFFPTNTTFAVLSKLFFSSLATSVRIIKSACFLVSLALKGSFKIFQVQVKREKYILNGIFLFCDVFHKGAAF